MSKTISSAHYTKVSSILTTQHLQEAYLACLFVKRKALSSFILLAAIAYYSHLLPGIRRVSNTALIFLGDICRMCVYANSEHNGASDHKSTDLQELVLRATLCVPLWVFVRVFRPWDIDPLPAYLWQFEANCVRRTKRKWKKTKTTKIRQFQFL